MSSQTVKISNEGDIILARLQVRELARSSGFNIMDQARISLAASLLAQTLRLGYTHPGYVTIEGIGGGIRVSCTKKNVQGGDGSTLALSEVRAMVDELTVERGAGDEITVTLVKRRPF